jgi:hypothetical protein
MVPSLATAILVPVWRVLYTSLQSLSEESFILVSVASALAKCVIYQLRILNLGLWRWNCVWLGTYYCVPKIQKIVQPPEFVHEIGECQREPSKRPSVPNYCRYDRESLAKSIGISHADDRCLEHESKGLHHEELWGKPNPPFKHHIIA